MPTSSGIPDNTLSGTHVNVKEIHTSIHIKQKSIAWSFDGNAKLHLIVIAKEKVVWRSLEFVFWTPPGDWRWYL
jgi:hypothetical protein